MTKDTADKISADLQSEGFDHARIIQGDEHRIELQRDLFDGMVLLTLMAILVPGGEPLPNVTVKFESQRGVLVVA